MDGDRNDPLAEPHISQGPSNTGPLFNMRQIGEAGSQGETLCSRGEPVPPRTKIQTLQGILERDLYAADLKWSLFTSAAHSYRCDTCLHPFPLQYHRDGFKDINTLREVLACVPSFHTLLNVLREPDIYERRGEAIDLLYWVLVEVREPTVKTVPKSQYPNILKLVPSEGKSASPNLIFQISWSKGSQAERRWRDLAFKSKTFFAFHGSRLENFYSIINFGLLNSMCVDKLNQPSLFGKGIYLSSELSMSLPYSKAGYGWGGSILGSHFSCVALCELVDHPDLKCQAPDGDPRRTIAEDTLVGEVPPKYYLSQNSDLVQLRYVLVYTRNSPQPEHENESTVVGWIRRNKLLTFMLGYAILLGSLGVANSPTVQRYYRMLLKRWGL